GTQKKALQVEGLFLFMLWLRARMPDAVKSQIGPARRIVGLEALVAVLIVRAACRGCGRPIRVIAIVAVCDVAIIGVAVIVVAVRIAAPVIIRRASDQCTGRE